METVNNFISTLLIAISNCSLYSKEHETFNELAKKTFSLLSELLGERFEIMVIDNELIVNKKPLRDAGINKTNLIRRLKRKGISRVDFLKGVSLSEINQFIIDISEAGKSLKLYAHINTGSIDVNVTSPKLDTVDIDSLSYASSEENEKLKDILHSISYFKKLNIAGLEELVVH